MGLLEGSFSKHISMKLINLGDLQAIFIDPLPNYCACMTCRANSQNDPLPHAVCDDPLPWPMCGSMPAV